jgi:hypothetical protein
MKEMCACLPRPPHLETLGWGDVAVFPLQYLIPLQKASSEKVWSDITTRDPLPALHNLTVNFSSLLYPKPNKLEIIEAAQVRHQGRNSSGLESNWGAKKATFYYRHTAEDFCEQSRPDSTWFLSALHNFCQQASSFVCQSFPPQPITAHVWCLSACSESM